MNKAINQVVEQIVNLRHEIHQDFNDLKHEIGTRLAAVETQLGIKKKFTGNFGNIFSITSSRPFG